MHSFLLFLLALVSNRRSLHQDAATRSRVETTLLPFLTLRNPRPDSIKFITDFSRRTGDFEVLSKPDIHLLALTYELELERNGGDWRIRNDPTQKTLNGKPPSSSTPSSQDAAKPCSALGEAQQQQAEAAPTQETPQDMSSSSEPTAAAEDLPIEPSTDVTPDQPSEAADQDEVVGLESKLEDLDLDPPLATELPCQEDDATGGPAEEESDDDDDDGEGWITPSNLKKQQAKDASAAGPKESSIQGTLQAALLTSDFAMQNVALRINLKCVSITRSN